MNGNTKNNANAMKSMKVRCISEIPRRFVNIDAKPIIAIVVAVMAAIKVIVRLTPSVKDDEVFGKIDKILEFIIPNYGSKKKK